MVKIDFLIDYSFFGFQQCQDTAGCNWMYCPDGETPNCILKREGTQCVCINANYVSQQQLYEINQAYLLYID